MTAESGPLLELKGLSKSFQVRGSSEPVKAVDDVDLTIMRGECVALVGESGSGKSTLARLALLLLAPDSGTVRFRGQLLTGMPTRELRRVRVEMQPVFQDPLAALNPRKRAGESLREALHLLPLTGRQKESRVIELLERVGLRPGSHYVSRFPHQLSGGQRQRLSIARAIAIEPSLLIGDEPLSGLDVSIRGQILNLLADLRRERGMAYLLITHDITVAQAFADKVAVMFKGRIVEQGPVRDVLANPAHEYTRELLAAVPVFTTVPVPAFPLPDVQPKAEASG